MPLIYKGTITIEKEDLPFLLYCFLNKNPQSFFFYQREEIYRENQQCWGMVESQLFHSANPI